MNPNEHEQPSVTIRPQQGLVHRWFRRLLVAGGIIVFAVTIAVTATLLATRPPTDGMFRGKLESEWIKEVKYYDEQQAEQWKEFGSEGVDVLIRGLRRAERPRERLYRKWYRNITRFLVADLHVPVQWTGILPEPRMDETAAERHRIVSLLSLMDEVAYPAAPSMIKSLRDEALSIQQSAIGYFNGSEGEHTPLDHLSQDDREIVFDYLIAAVAQTNQNSIQHLRNNAALALRYFPNRKTDSVPALLGAIPNTSSGTSASVIETLLLVDPAQSGNSNVVDVLIAVLNDLDDQVAYRAPPLLGKMSVDTARIVDELIRHLKNESSLVATAAAQALGNFPEHSGRILPPLWEAHNDPGHHARTWGTGRSLKKLDPDGAAAAGTR